MGEKVVFLVMFTNFGKDMTEKLGKQHAKMHILIGSIFIPGKCVLRVCLKVLFEDDIQPEIQVVPLSHS